MASITNRVTWVDNTADLTKALLNSGDAIVAMKDAVDRTATSLGGTGLLAKANQAAAAIDQLGGITKLTGAEQDKVNTLLDKAIEKYNALGVQAPSSILALSQAINDANQSTEGWLGILGSLGNSFVARVAEGLLLRDAIREVLSVVGEGITAFPDLVEHTAEVGNSLYEMSLKTGSSVEGLSALRYVASQTGVDFNSFGTVLGTMEAKLGSTGAAGAKVQTVIGNLGLSFSAIKGEGADQAFIDIAQAIDQVPNNADKAYDATTLLGRGAKEMAGLWHENIGDMLDDAKQLGLITSTQMAATAHVAETEYKALGLQVESVGMRIGSAFLPAVIGIEHDLSQGLNESVKTLTSSLGVLGGNGGIIGLVATAMGTGSDAIGAQVALYGLLKDGLITLVRDALEPMVTAVGFVMTEFQASKVILGDVAQVLDGVRLAYLLTKQTMSLGLLPGQADLGAWKALDTQISDLEAKMSQRDQSIQNDKKVEQDWSSWSTQAVAAVDAAMKKLGDTHTDVAALIAKFTAIAHNAYQSTSDDVGGTTGKLSLYQKAVLDANSAGEDWHATLDTIDGRLVDNAEALLKSGMSVSELGAYYGLTDVQVKALQEDIKNSTTVLKDTSESIDRTAGIWSDYFSVVAKGSSDALGSQLAAADTWYDKQVTTLDKTAAYNLNYWSELEALQADHDARRQAAIDAAATKELQTEAKLQDDIQAADDSSAAVGLEKIEQAIYAKAQKEADALNISLLGYNNYWYQRQLLDDRANAQIASAEAGWQRSIDKEVQGIAAQDQDVLIGLYETGAQKEIDVATTKRNAKLAQLHLEGKDTSDVIAAENQLYTDQVTAIIAKYDPMLKAWQALNTDMRTEWASSWAKVIDTGAGVSDALLQPFTDLKKNFEDILGSMIADFEQQFLAPLLNLAKSGMSQLASSITGGIGGTSGGSGGSGGGGLFGNILGGLFGGGSLSSGFGSLAASSSPGELDSLGNDASLGSTQFSGIGSLVGGGVTAASGLTTGGGIAGGIAAGAVTMGIGIAVPLIIAALGAIDPVKSGIQDLAKSWGTTFSDALVKQIESDATTKFDQTSQGASGPTGLGGAGNIAADLGGMPSLANKPNEVAATTYNLSSVIQGDGGLDTTNIDKYTQHLRDAFSMLQTNVFTVADTTKVLDDNFKSFTDAGTSGVGVLNAKIVELTSLNEQYGTDSKAIGTYLGGQATTAASSFGTALSVTGTAMTQLSSDQAALADTSKLSSDQIDALNKDLKTQQGIIDATSIKTEGAAAAIGAGLAGTFGQMIKSGDSFEQAITAIAPSVDAMGKQLLASGLTGGAAFTGLKAEVDLASDAIAGPALTSVDSLGAGLTSLANMGMLNQSTFSDLGSQIDSTFNSLVAQGNDGATVMVGMQQPLQQLWELQQQYGYTVDASTQSLIDQGVQSGIIGESQKSDQEKILDVLTAIGKALGADLPADMDVLANAGSTAAHTLASDMAAVSGALATDPTGLSASAQAAAKSLTDDLAAASKTALTDPNDSVLANAIQAATALETKFQTAAHNAGNDLAGIASRLPASFDFTVNANDNTGGGGGNNDDNGGYGSTGGLVTTHGIARYMRQGGKVLQFPGQPKPPDVIPAWLAVGERVLNVDETNDYDAGLTASQLAARMPTPVAAASADRSHSDKPVTIVNHQTISIDGRPLKQWIQNLHTNGELAIPERSIVRRAR